MKKTLARQTPWIIAGLLVLVTFLMAFFVMSKVRKNFEVMPLPVLGTIPEFILTNDQSQSFGLSDLHGQIWIADFIFTRCSGICPMMSSRMMKLQKDLQGTGIKLVSFSVDSEYDTPQILQAYRLRYQADPARWFFLTGDKKIIFNLSLQHFHLGVMDIPAEERTAMEEAVGHSSKFVLVDREGRIRGYYSSDELGALEKLIRDARFLEK